MKMRTNEDEDKDKREDDKKIEEEVDEAHEKDGTAPSQPKLTYVGFDHMDIVDAIGQLALCSGPGPDGVSAILLKKANISIALMLRNIFQHSLDQSEIPDILKLGFICPILKPNSSREKPASWRPVSLTSHIMKTFERVIRRQIVNHLESNNLMDRDQHGSRRGRSCLSQLLEHQDEILRSLEEGHNVDVVYTDFEKAFEKVDHRKLVEKMKSQFGIEGKLGKWLQCFLEKRKQQIVIEETKSGESNVRSGAIQGSVLGPIFFLMFISDITVEISSSMKVFVDDAKIKEAIEDEEGVEKLQQNLDKLYEWELENKMKFNGSKFQLLRYGTNEEIKNNTIYFTTNMEEVIDQFSSLRDLGVIMSDNARFDDHIEKVATTVRRKIGWVLRTFYTRRVDILKELWKSLIQCHIDYCSQLYMPGHALGMQKIEKLFYDFTSRIPEVRHEHYWNRLQRLNMYSQERRMERYRILYVWKILAGVVPNCGVELAQPNERLGRKCKVPKLVQNGRQAMQTLREQGFQVNGVRLFNCLPKSLRNMKTNQDDFKIELDKFLSKIPDQPRIGGLVPEATCRLTARQSNSLLAWIQET